jgi:ketosteroid isomerase-like protein
VTLIRLPLALAALLSLACAGSRAASVRELSASSEVRRSPAPGARVDTTITKAALVAADSAVAADVDAHGAAAFLDAIELGAPLLFPGQPILSARDDARRAFLARYGAPSSYGWRATHAVASVDGQFGCTVGFSRFRDRADTAQRERRGTFTTCWRRASDGQWRVIAHQRNDSPPTPPRNADDAVLLGAPHSAVVALGAAPTRDAQDTDAAFAAMAAEAAGPGPAFAAYAAPDAILLSPAGRPRGPDEIQRVFDGFPSDGVLVWQPMRSFGAGSGGLAFTVGHSVTKARHDAARPEIHGKFLTVWRQELDGRWRYIFDLGSPRP